MDVNIICHPKPTDVCWNLADADDAEVRQDKGVCVCVYDDDDDDAVSQLHEVSLCFGGSTAVITVRHVRLSFTLSLYVSLFSF